MPAAYSADLRNLALEMCAEGKTASEVAEVLKIGRSTVERWQRIFEEEGRRVAKVGYQQGHSRRITGSMELFSWIENNKNSTLEEIGKNLSTPCSRSTVHRAMRRYKMTHKKRVSVHPA